MGSKIGIGCARMLFAAALFACTGIATNSAAADARQSVFDWTGFYLGATAGRAWGATNHYVVGGPNATDDFDIKGWLAGGTLGWNWQTGAFVLGLETDLSASDINGRIVGNSGSFGCGLFCRTDVSAFGSVRGRAGYAFDRTLVFVTGGLVYADVEGEIGGPGVPGSITRGSDWRTGWTAGAGIEFAFDPAWSAKIEYLHVDVSDINYSPNFNGVALGAGARFGLVRFGLNYRWGRE
jgi:outer membrane immunogenic protein